MEYNVYIYSRTTTRTSDQSPMLINNNGFPCIYIEQFFLSNSAAHALITWAGCIRSRQCVHTCGLFTYVLMVLAHFMVTSDNIVYE